jgi:hypothetical protein
MFIYVLSQILYNALVKVYGFLELREPSEQVSKPKEGVMETPRS